MEGGPAPIEEEPSLPSLEQPDMVPRPISQAPNPQIEAPLQGPENP